MLVASNAVPPAGGARPVRSALLQKLCSDEGLLALGGSVARVVQLASSDNEGTRSLAYYVLSDVALTQKILRLANTSTYRTANGTPVTTISRAITLLGLDSVKTTALALLLVEALSNSVHAHSVRVELEAALCASLVGREMGRLSFYQGSEEAAIGALFKNIGSLLIASREYERFREIGALIAAGKHTPGQASQMILGCSFDAVSAAVLQHWNMPDMIQHALGTLPPGVQKAALNRQEWMRQVATFSLDAARLLAHEGDPCASAEALALEQRFGGALNLNQERMAILFATVQRDMRDLLDSLNLAPPPRVVAESAGLPNVLLLATMDAGGGDAPLHHPSGKPGNARELLLAGVQETIQLRAGGQCQVNDLMLAVLETLYYSMGFRFATVCLKDVKAGQYRARLACGAHHAERQAGFFFGLSPERSGSDLFHLAMDNDADLMIADTSTPKIAALLPPWHRALLPDARSFIVLPLVHNGVALGLFYADRIHPAPEGVPPDEASLIRALKGVLLAALGT